jgi:hypothetical protein
VHKGDLLRAVMAVEGRLRLTEHERRSRQQARADLLRASSVLTADPQAR